MMKKDEPSEIDGVDHELVHNYLAAKLPPLPRGWTLQTLDRWCDPDKADRLTYGFPVADPHEDLRWHQILCEGNRIAGLGPGHNQEVSFYLGWKDFEPVPGHPGVRVLVLILPEQTRKASPPLEGWTAAELINTGDPVMIDLATRLIGHCCPVERPTGVLRLAAPAPVCSGFVAVEDLAKDETAEIDFQTGQVRKARP